MLSPDGHTIHLHLVDGGRGDTDGVANGQIADPVITGLPRPTAAFAGQFSSFRLTTDSHHGTVEWSVVAEAAGGPARCSAA